MRKDTTRETRTRRGRAGRVVTFLQLQVAWLGLTFPFRSRRSLLPLGTRLQSCATLLCFSQRNCSVLTPVSYIQLCSVNNRECRNCRRHTRLCCPTLRTRARHASPRPALKSMCAPGRSNFKGTRNIRQLHWHWHWHPPPTSHSLRLQHLIHHHNGRISYADTIRHVTRRTSRQTETAAHPRLVCPQAVRWMCHS